MTKFRTIDTSSTFIGWGKLDQQVTVKVLTFELEGGTDAKGNRVPRLVGTLVEDCDNYRNLSGEKEHVVLRAGTQVTVEAGIENLRKGLVLANPKRDDLVRLTFVDTYNTDKGNKGKVIKVEHAPASEVADSVTEDDI